jgi:hypothetical protein
VLPHDPTASAAGLRAKPGVVDYDLHGIVRIRLIDAGVRDVAAVTAQVGLPPGPPAADPDIVVRFVEHLPLARPVRHIGVRDAGFTDDAFLLLRGPHKSRVHVRIPLEDVGGRCEIVCESGLRAVPLLIAVANASALAKGVLPMHAAAFTYEGAGTLVTGWARGGKTETLLAFMARGAVYIGDEWVYLTPDGRMLGLPEPIKLWDWHLAEAPDFLAALDRHARARLRRFRGLDLGLRFAGRALAGRGAGLQARLHHLLESQRYVHAHPEQLFGADRCSLGGRLDKVVLVVSGDEPRVWAEPTDAGEIARRMLFSLEHERLDLRAAYLKFRFAFPQRRNPLFDQMGAIQEELLMRALDGTEAHVVHHPYPAPIATLFDVLAPLVRGRAEEGRRRARLPVGADLA